MKKAFPALRKVLFWMHLAAGIAAGLVILVMAVSGTLISFERQITEAANGFHITVPAGGKKMEAEELMAAVQQALPEAGPSAITLQFGPQDPAIFQFGREKTLFVDPYTGAVLGEGAKKTRAFFQFMTGMHRWLALQGKAHDVGQQVTSAAALVFFFLILSGLFLWIPKRWTRKGVKVITTFQRGLKGRARDWNWHNVLGIWFALPLLVFSATGVIMAYSWAQGMLYASVGEKAPPERGQGGPGGRGGEGRGGEGRRGGTQGPMPWPETTEGFNDAFAVATKAVPGWQSAQLQIPRRDEAILAVTSGDRGRPDLKQTITVDLNTADILKTEKFADQSKGRQLRTWVRWIHTGEAGGWIGQTVAALSTLAAVALIWTGFALSWRRFFRKRVKGPVKIEAAEA